MSAGEPVRSFVALEIEERILAGVAELVDELGPKLRGARFVKPHTLHLTLRFLGDAAPDRLLALHPGLGGAATECPASSARVSGLGVFPDRGSPRVLWLGLDLPPAIFALQRRCEQAAVAAGFAREERTFRPHLTLARFRDRVARPSLPALDLGECRLDTLTLYRSDLRPSGAVHTPLAAWPLRGRG